MANGHNGNALTRRFPNSAAGRELQKVLAADEPIEALAVGKGGAILVATDRRAVIVKAGAAATGQFFGRKVGSYGYGQISAVNVQAGALDGYVEIVAGGVNLIHNPGRYAQLVSADNICPFARKVEGEFRAVVECIQRHLYGAGSGGAGTSAIAAHIVPSQDIPTQIAALARLRDAGVLNAAEFEAKKAELLARM